MFDSTGYWGVTLHTEEPYQGKRNGKYFSAKWKTVKVFADTPEEAIRKAKAEAPDYPFPSKPVKLATVARPPA